MHVRAMIEHSSSKKEAHLFEQLNDFQPTKNEFTPQRFLPV